MPSPIEPDLQPLRIGVLGCANIAKQFVRDVKPSERVRITAVASRNAEKAKDFAAAHGIDTAFSSYEALLASSDVQAIYIPLPNSMHLEWAVKAAQSGKHVLCEKPLALDRAEAEKMFAAARDNKVMLIETFPYYFQPQTAALLAMLKEGAIGAVRFMQASFGFSLPTTGNNIRLDPSLGGGALLDAGSYPLSLIRTVMGEAPVRVDAVASWADTGVDMSVMATLHYSDGRRAQMSCSMDTANHRRAIIMGSMGTIETEYLNHTSEVTAGHPYGYQPSQLRVRRGIAATIPFEEVHSEVGSGFFFAAEAFAKAVAAKDETLMAHSAAFSIDNAATLAAIIASAKQGVSVSV